ncbi:phage baseplate assembly protein V [Pseudomonas sp. NPDC086251]|uniref:phage baseplate assembly protein V n=1 Tax=Pseudomonas sp. NPDC086251 TaxID=3364431 RepID=UPI003838B0B9
MTLQPIWCSTTQRVNAIPTARLLLSTEGNALETLSRCDAEIALCKPGNPISIMIDRQGQWDLLFKGIIVEQRLSLLKTSAQLELVIKHPLARLASTCRSQVFSNQSAQAIISGLLAEQQLSCTNQADMKTVQEQLIQFRCSDWLYVRRLVDESGAWLLPEFEDVKIVTPTLAGTPDHTLKSTEVNRETGTEGQSSIFEASWRFSDRYQPEKLSLTAWDIAKQELIVAMATAQALGQDALNPARQKPLTKAPWVIGSSASISQEKLEALAQSTLQHLHDTSVLGEFQVRGSVSYKLGQTLALAQFGQGFDGAGIITAVSHSVDKTSWKTVIALGMKDGSGELTPLATPSGLQVGVVAEFKTDPNDLNRLRVSLPVLGDDNNTVWVRLAMPYASSDGGFYFYPNPGDEVVVGFFDHDPCFPVLLGSMYNPQNPPLVNVSKENKVKGMAFNDMDLLFQFDTQSTSAALCAKASVEVKADEIKLVTK